MPVIKSHSPHASSARPFSIADIEAHARAILLKAQRQAEQYLAAAQAEAEAMKIQAHADGLVQGKKDGLAQGKAEGTKVGQKQAFDQVHTEHQQKLTEVLQALTEASTQLEASRQMLVDRADAEVLPLALTIARKVTKRLGDLDPRVVEANLREAVRLVTNKHNVRIAINPEQRLLIEELIVKLQHQWPQMQHVALVDDANICSGGCRISTAGGEIDADLDAQLDRIARELVPENQT